MKCVICKQTDTEAGHATIVFEHEGLTLVFRAVPARVCPNCGEEYVEEEIAAKLLKDAEAAINTGVRVEVREYLAV